MTNFIAAFLLTVSIAASAPPHAGLLCSDCHVGGGAKSDPAAAASRAPGCRRCHQGHERIFDHAMTTRTAEQQFVKRSYEKMDSGFFTKNCVSCHVRGCLDCHGRPHSVSKPSTSVCQSCHKGYFTGWDYSGFAPRQDNMRYQRGPEANGERFLKMLPDVHFSAGLSCGDCHSMRSLTEGRSFAKHCLDCHTPDKSVPEHGITQHMTGLECFACHSSWAAQEYGTFYLRFRDPSAKEEFDLRPGISGEYLKSAYLRKQDEPPLGINYRGRVSPIRPQFIAYYTDIMSARNSGPENILLAAEWRSFFPHTIQRGTVTCESCHDSQRRFIFEPEHQKIYHLRKDGMTLESFWRKEGQTIANGSFLDHSRLNRILKKDSVYMRVYLKKWKNIVNRADPS